jgi:hypothetical protein
MQSSDDVATEAFCQTLWGSGAGDGILDAEVLL